ncbi:MAG: topoisomerase C-terminal repeat-containing protein, partial [Firmicutes bacterium]|nr:topoisomerase C-terminal repeat-containing protein [Bacillota bacterium]
MTEAIEKKLIIAEKPSLGRAIMASLPEKFDKQEEYYRSDHYYVVPLHGHILELKDFEDYKANEGKAMWNVKNLPFFPDQYEYRISKGNQKIYNCIRKLLKEPEVTEVIHCGDADREGQIIVDLVLEKIGNTKPVTRPFIKSTTKAGLQKAFEERRPNEEYININAEGKTREYVDFDFGKNLSRFASRKAGVKNGLNVGRVIGAIVTAIYDRDLEIENFVPREFFKVESDGEVKLTSKREFTVKAAEESDAATAKAQAEAQAYADKLNGADLVVTDVKKTKQTKKAPRLFSQTDLQGAANKRHGFSPKRTLKSAQSLYEKGLITYPRTNTNFMANGDRPMVGGILGKMGDEFEMKPVFDDSKVDGHSAITPTGEAGSAEKYKSLSADEQKIYMLVLNRFKAVFCKEPCTVLKTTMAIEARDPKTGDTIEEFKVSGEVPLTQGWKKYEHVTEQVTQLPDLAPGDLVDHDFQPVASQTKPPAHYTVTTLGKWMQNPFRKSEEDEIDYAKMLSGMEIGTEATRAAIIDKAIAKEYIDLTKNTYTIRPNGRFLVETCRALGIDMSSVKTAEMGRDTKAVSRGEKTCGEVLSEVREEIARIIGNGRQVELARTKESEHSCPRCGQHLQESVQKLECACGYSLWKTVARKSLDDKTIQTLLAGKKTPLIRGFKSKAGRSFSAHLVPAEDGSVSFEFEERPEKVSPGKCPKCGKPVYENKKGFGCSGWKPGGKGCDFVIWKNDKATGKKTTAEEAKILLAKAGGL